MKKELRTKSGRLTPYALACGYIEEKTENNVYLKLWHEGGPLYHVGAFDHELGKRIFWDSFEKLTDARKRFLSFKFE